MPSARRSNGSVPIRDREQDAGIRLEAAQQARGESGGRAIEAVRAMEGVHGTISDLGKAPPSTSTALNIAAGNKLQFVVSDDDQIAADAIRYLKDERLGPGHVPAAQQAKTPADFPRSRRPVSSIMQ